MEFDKVIQKCPKEVVSIYPPITEISEQTKREIFKKQSVELKDALLEQMYAVLKINLIMVSHCCL
jgi:hypothetical protein